MFSLMMNTVIKLDRLPPMKLVKLMSKTKHVDGRTASQTDRQIDNRISIGHPHLQCGTLIIHLIACTHIRT